MSITCIVLNTACISTGLQSINFTYDLLPSLGVPHRRLSHVIMRHCKPQHLTLPAASRTAELKCPSVLADSKICSASYRFAYLLQLRLVSLIARTSRGRPLDEATVPRFASEQAKEP